MIDELMRTQCGKALPASLSVFCVPAAAGRTSFARKFAAENIADTAVVCSTRRSAKLFKEQLFEVLVSEGGAPQALAPSVFTAESLAFYLLQGASINEDDPDEDRRSFKLLSGAEQMNLIEECTAQLQETLLEGDTQSESIVKALSAPSFKQELREFFEMVSDRSLSLESLSRLAEREGDALLQVAIQLYQLYSQRLHELQRYDHISLLSSTSDALREGSAQFAARYILVDDAQDLTHSGLRLLQALAQQSGARVVMLYNEYLVSNGFRGSLGSALVKQIAPENVHFFGGYTPKVAAQSVAQQRIADLNDFASPGEANCQVYQAASALEQATYVAQAIREDYLAQLTPDASDLDTVSADVNDENTGGADANMRSQDAPASLLSLPNYAQYAVIAHSQSSLTQAASILRSKGIPVSLSSGARALRDEPLWASFEAFLGLALGSDIAPASRIPQVRSCVLSLLESIRAQRDDFDPSAQKAQIEEFGSTLAEQIDATETLPSLLWRIWERSGAAETLQNEVLRGVQTDFANHHLNIAMQIFSLAEKFYLERESTPTRALVEEFLQYIDALEVAADNIYAHEAADAVQLLTPAAASGQHFSRVFCIDFNESSFPNTRLRDSILHTSLIPEVVAALEAGEHLPLSSFTEIERRQANLQSEFCLLNIVLTRSAKVDVIVVEDEESTASPFAKLFPEPVLLADLPKLPQSLEEMTKQYRFEAVRYALESGASADKLSQTAQVQTLAEMMAEDTDLVDTRNWYYNEHLPPPQEAFLDDDTIALKPSALESLLECPLRWFLGYAGGVSTQVEESAQMGTVVHKVLQLVPDLQGSLDETVEKMWQVYDDLQNEKATLKEGENPQDYVLQFESNFDAEMAKFRLQRFFDNACAYYDHIANLDLPRSVEEIEYSPEVKVVIDQKMTISGQIDRVETDASGRKYVADWKTSKTPWKPPSEDIPENLQVLAYQKLIDAEDPGSTAGGDLVYLGKDGKIDGKISTQQPLADLREVADEMFTRIAQSARAKSYTAQTSSKCAYCDLRNACALQEEGRRL